MPTIWNASLLDPIYRSQIAVDATLITVGGDEVPAVRVIDKTVAAPILGGGGVDFQAFRPFAMLRMSDVARNALDVQADLFGGQLTMNGKTWLIKSYEYVPTPNGVPDGELRLILQDSGQ